MGMNASWWMDELFVELDGLEPWVWSGCGWMNCQIGAERHILLRFMRFVPIGVIRTPHCHVPPLAWSVWDEPNTFRRKQRWRIPDEWYYTGLQQCVNSARKPSFVNISKSISKSLSSFYGTVWGLWFHKLQLNNRRLNSWGRMIVEIRHLVSWKLENCATHPYLLEMIQMFQKGIDGV